MDVTKEGHFKTMCHSSKKAQSCTSTQPKVVQKVQAQDDQNTGKAKNVDIVDMVRSMGLHGKSAKSIVHDDLNPVFYTPVEAQDVTTALAA